MIINIKSGMKKRVTKQKQIILETIRKDRSHEIRKAKRQRKRRREQGR